MEHTFVERHKLVLLDPIKLKSVNLTGRSAFPLHRLESFGQGLDLFRDTENELVVADIDGTADQLTTLRVSAGNDQILTAHQIPLESCSDKTVDVFAHGDKNLACQVATLLATMHLVLEVNCSRAVLSEKLRQLQNR